MAKIRDFNYTFMIHEQALQFSRIVHQLNQKFKTLQYQSNLRLSNNFKSKKNLNQASNSSNLSINKKHKMEIEENKTRLVVLKQPRLNKGLSKRKEKLLKKHIQNQIGQRQAKIILKPLNTQREIFLPFDQYIEYNGLDEESAFQLRPVISVNHLKNLKFLEVNLDQTQRGIKEFKYVIYQLNSLQDKNYHQLANQLQVFQNNLETTTQMSQIRSIPQIQERNYQIFSNFMNEEVKSLLQEQDPSGFYTYFLVQCVDNLSDASVIQSGCNENYIKLIGSDVDTCKNLIMRQGNYQIANYNKRNQVTSDFLDILSQFFENNFDITNIQICNDIHIVTLDGIKLSLKAVPQIHICYGINEEGIPGHKSILGYLYIKRYKLDQKQIQHIISMRQQKKAQICNLFYEQPEQSFQHFEYKCQAEHFQYFSQKHSQQYPFLQDYSSDYSSKTCKIRLV